MGDIKSFSSQILECVAVWLHCEGKADTHPCLVGLREDIVKTWNVCAWNIQYVQIWQSTIGGLKIFPRSAIFGSIWSHGLCVFIQLCYPFKAVGLLRFYMWGKFPNKFHFQSESDWNKMWPVALLCWRKTWQPPHARGKLLLKKTGLDQIPVKDSRSAQMPYWRGLGR